MVPTLLIDIVVIFLALAFSFSNGFNDDAANVVATVIAKEYLHLQKQ